MVLGSVLRNALTVPWLCELFKRDLETLEDQTLAPPCYRWDLVLTAQVAVWTLIMMSVSRTEYQSTHIMYSTWKCARREEYVHNGFDVALRLNRPIHVHILVPPTNKIFFL